MCLLLQCCMAKGAPPNRGQYGTMFSQPVSRPTTHTTGTDAADCHPSDVSGDPRLQLCPFSDETCTPVGPKRRTDIKTAHTKSCQENVSLGAAALASTTPKL